MSGQTPSPAPPADDDWRVDGKKPFVVPPAPPKTQAERDEERVEENTPPPPDVRWPPKATERLEEEPEELEPEVKRENDRRYARYSLIAGDVLVAATYSVAFGLGVDGSASLKLSLAFGSFAVLLGPGLLVAFNQTDRSMAEVWLDWFAWLGGGLTAAAVMIGQQASFFEVASAMALAGLVAHLALVLTPDREGVAGLELLLMGVGFTIATVGFAMFAGGLSSSNSSDGIVARAMLAFPGVVLAATRVGFAAGHAWGWKPTLGPVDRLSFFAAPRPGGLTTGVGLVF